MANPIPAKTLIFSPRTWDLKEFEALSAAAKDAGFTHIAISELAERTDLQGAEKDSPWTEWSALLPTIFKHATPPGLEDAFPADFVRRQMDFMKAKHRIVEKLDMRAAYFGQEPQWLNDRVYRKHPQWRGSRADNSLRTTGIYFSPNTDHPEVRALYRTAVCEIVRQCPRLDFFAFGTNDSGGFYPWDKRLFSGPNGPTGYEGRDMGKRVVDFLAELRAGAKDAGVDAKIFTNIHGWFTDDEKHLVMRSLTPGLGCANGSVPPPYTAECSLLGCGVWGGSSVWHPGNIFHNFPAPMSVIGGVSAVKTHPALQFCSGGNSVDYFKAFKIAMSMPPATTPRTKVDVLTRMAQEMYAPDVAEEILAAWYTLERVDHMLDVTAFSPLVTVMLRWLTRPFVAHQERLTEDEKSYWVPYIYQSQKSHPDKWLDYLNNVGYQLISNWAEASKVCCALDSVEGALAAAAAQLEAAAAKTANQDAAERLVQEGLQIRAMRSVALTYRHYLQLGTLIYVRDQQNALAPKTTATSPELTPMPKGDLGDQGLWYLHRAMRWELDNTNELIDLIKRAKKPLFFTAPVPSWTGALVLEKDLLANLERKVEITLNHWRDAESGWYRPTYGG
ncbi:MAG: hypothetical protein K8T26_16260 [Lentisphaerae bacterium]|nr:hypothetical protein [Lentisphaerota bacterium]